jgi:ferredoxin
MNTNNGQDEFATNPNVKVRVKVIKELCISAATCVITAANTFDLDEDDIAYVKEVDWDDAQTILEGAMSCPTNAIIVEDLDGKRLWPKE